MSTDVVKRISGRTRPGRLALLDAWCLQRIEPPTRVVDIGFGQEPWTTFELEVALDARFGVAYDFVALDVEVDHARQLGHERGSRVRFESIAGFDIPHTQIDLMRAMNVLRGYPEDAIDEAWSAWTSRLAPRGRLYEGSTDHEGHVLVAVELMPGTPYSVSGIVFATDFARGFSPWLFRDWLPRRWRRDALGEHWVGRWMRAWVDAWEKSRSAGAAPSESFHASLEAVEGWSLEFSANVERGSVFVSNPDQVAPKLMRRV